MKKYLCLIGTLALPQIAWANAESDSLQVHRLQEVAVIGTRATKKTPMSYSNVKREELKKLNLGQDVPYLLLLQPSVVSTSDAGTGIGYTGIRVRGVDATGTNVTANGVPINDSESQGVFWVNMPDLTSSLEEMQLQRGIGTSSNGAGSFGASLNMRTNNLSTRAYGELSLSGGSFATFRRNVRVGTGTLAGHWAVDARLSKITSDGYVDRGSVDLTSYFVQAGYFNGGTVLKFVTFGGKEITGIAWNGISPEQEQTLGRRYNSAGDMMIDGKAGVRYYHNTDNYNQGHNHLILTQRLSPSLNLNLTGHYTKGFGYTHEYRTGQKLVKYALKPYTTSDGSTVSRTSLIRRKYLDNDFVGLIGNLNWKPEGWDITLGISGNHYTGLHYGELPWIAHYPTVVYPEDRYYESKGSKLDLSSYLKLSYQVTPQLSIYGDIQYRHIDYKITGTGDGYSDKLSAMQTLHVDERFDFLNPKAGLYWQWHKQHHAYASIAIAHREPKRSMYTDAGVDAPLPKPEKMIDYELGYGFSSPRLSLSANLYYMHYRDQLVMSGKWSDVGEALLENIPDSYRLGVELSASAKPLDCLRLDASLALSRNKLKDYNYTYAVYDDSYEWTGEKTIVHQDVDIAYSPQVVASGALTFTRGGFEASLIGQAVGSQYLDNTANSGRQLPAYTIANLRLGYRIPIKRFAKEWSISLLVNNLFDKQYHSNGWVYDMGIKTNGSTAFNDLRLYPQAGINCLVGTTLTF